MQVCYVFKLPICTHPFRRSALTGFPSGDKVFDFTRDFNRLKCLPTFFHNQFLHSSNIKLIPVLQSRHWWHPNLLPIKISQVLSTFRIEKFVKLENWKVFSAITSHKWWMFHSFAALYWGWWRSLRMYPFYDYHKRQTGSTRKKIASPVKIVGRVSFYSKKINNFKISRDQIYLILRENFPSNWNPEKKISFHIAKNPFPQTI